MEAVTNALQSLNGYRIDAQDFAWNHKLEIGLPLLTILLSMWGRRFWLTSQTVLAVLFHALPMILFPETFLLTYTAEGKTDATHVHLLRWIGILVITQALTYWLLSKSSDSTVETSQLWAKTVQTGCIGMALAYVYFYPPRKSSTSARVDPKMIPAGLISTVLHLFINLYYSVRSQDWAGYTEQVSHRNTHIRIDSILHFIFGVMWFASPSLFLNCQLAEQSPDSLHVYLSRIVGTFLIYMAILSGRAVTFLRDSDKDAVIFPRLVCYLTLFVLFAVGQLRNWEKMDLKNAALMSADELFLIFSSVVAMSVDVPKYLTQTLIPRTQQIPRDLQRSTKIKIF